MRPSFTDRGSLKTQALAMVLLLRTLGGERNFSDIC